MNRVRLTPPDRKKCSNAGITTLFFGSEEQQCFLRGAISFPQPVEDGGMSGALCLCGLFSGGELAVFGMRNFSDYNDAAGTIFAQWYEQYGATDYYYTTDWGQGNEGTKFLCKMEYRQYRKMDKVYPRLYRFQPGSDFQATAFLQSRKDRIFTRDKLFTDALMRWNEEKPFSEAPPEIKGVCLCASAMEFDGWKAFAGEEILRSEPHEPEW